MEGNMQLNVELPQNKYPLERYNSKVLVDWLQRTALIRALRLADYLSRSRGEPEYNIERMGRYLEADFKFQEIASILLLRGFTDDFIVSEKHEAEKDVQS